MSGAAAAAEAGSPRAPSNAFVTIDLDAPGRQAGWLRIPHSPHDDAWGVTQVPIAVIANGAGPTVLLMGGNHGDEYEGPITLGEMIRTLDPARVQGRLIILPAVNAPAVAAGQRTSPVDGLNFNRTFPGNPLGTLTQQISAYVHDRLFPLAEAFIDLHSGGSSLDITPAAIVEPAADDAGLHRRNIDAVLAFDAPLTVMINNLGDPRTSTASAVRAGLVTVGTEMGGAGTTSREALAVCRRGVARVLAHLGVLDGPRPELRPRAMWGIPGPLGYVYAAADGVFEPAHDRGAPVRAGEVAGWVHALTDPAREPQALLYGADGIVFGRRHPGRVRPGNCCMVVAAPWQG